MAVDRMAVLSAMMDQGVIPVFYHHDVEVCKKVIQACVNSGAKCIEFTNRGDFASHVFYEVATGSDDAFIASSARLLVAIEALDEIAAAREKSLIFLEDLDLQAKLAGLLQRRYGMASPPALINGTVDGGKRQARVNAFQTSRDGFDTMILSPRAGGVGLTLTRANHVIHLSRWWNPAVEDQCNGRVHRIGQTKPIFVHLPLATIGGTASSFDENLDALLDRKRKLMRDTLIPAEATVDQDREQLFKATVG